jgi:hypothetical protein
MERCIISGCKTSDRRLAGKWQGQQGSNPRPAVLETAALPTELYPYLGAWLFPQAAKFFKRPFPLTSKAGKIIGEKKGSPKTALSKSKPCGLIIR